MPKEKQTSGWRERLADWVYKEGVAFVNPRLEAFIASERRKVAKAMAEAVVPSETWNTPTDASIIGWEYCQAEVSRRAEEFIAKL